MGIILAFSAYFFVANRRQSKGKKIIERTVSVEDYEHEVTRLKKLPGGFPVHILEVNG